jgi:hypothetical protein
VILAAAALAAAATPGSAGAAVDPGDILVTGRATGNGINGAVIEVDPATGAQTVISDNAISSTALFDTPRGIVVDDAGNILVADAETGAGNTGAVISVDPTTGEQTLLSDNTINTGADLFEEPEDVALEADGSILVADNATGTADRVIRVNPATGQQTLVSDNTVNTGTDLFTNLAGITVEPSGQILVTVLDADAPHGSGGAVIRVNPATGQQSVVSSNSVNTGTDRFAEPWGVTTNTSGGILVTDAGVFADGGVVLGIDGAGQQTALSDNTINTGTDLFEEPVRSEVDADGNIIVADRTCCTGVAGGVIRVNPMTGQQTLVSDGDNFLDPFDLTIVPADFEPPGPPQPPPPGGGGGGGGTVTPTPIATPPAPPKCRKGQKLKGGKCVKKKRKKRKK